MAGRLARVNPKSALSIGAAVLLTGALAGAAHVTDRSSGSVPDVVAHYVASELLADLDDLVGVGADGKGIDFGDASTVGSLHRAWVFTPAFLGGERTDIPVALVNLWAAPVSVDDAPVGVATIWIDPRTASPALADFERDADAATALEGVPEGARLVRDAERAAWFALEETRLTPLVAGASGLAAPTVLTVYQGMLQRAPAAPVASVGGFPPLPLIVLGLGVLVVAAALVLLGRREVTVPSAAGPAAVQTHLPVAEPSDSVFIDPDFHVSPRKRGS